MAKLKLATILGSIRNNSNSEIVMKAIKHSSPSEIEFFSIDVANIPLYNEDIEHTVLPSAVVKARHILSEVDAVIIVTPEFNHGIPGVLKNTLDWLSRPAFDNHMINKYVFFVTQSPSPLGGVRAQYQLRETLSAMLCNFVPLPEIAITQITEKISDNTLNDERTTLFLKKQLEAFISALPKN